MLKTSQGQAWPASNKQPPKLLETHSVMQRRGRASKNANHFCFCADQGEQLKRIDSSGDFDRCDVLPFRIKSARGSTKRSTLEAEFGPANPDTRRE